MSLRALVVVALVGAGAAIVPPTNWAPEGLQLRETQVPYQALDAMTTMPWVTWKYCPADSEFYEKDVLAWLPHEFYNRYSVNKSPKIQSFLEQQAQIEPADGVVFLEKPYNTNLNEKIAQDMEVEKYQAHEIKQEYMKKVGLMEMDSEKKEGTAKPVFETWFVNQDKATDRKACLGRQLMELGQKPLRFSAVEFPEECMDSDAPEHCLTSHGFGDCFQKGIDYSSINTHGSQSNSQRKMAFRVVANWCSHKRLFEQLAESKSDATHFLVLEDDVILDREWTMKVLEDFAENYKEKSWDLLQIDPFGAKAKQDYQGTFKGKPVWKPGHGDGCQQYWGFQAVVVKKDGLPRINEWMSKNAAIPVDWLPTRMPGSLAYGGLIARNPEERQFGRKIAVPDFCPENAILQSSIASIEPEDKKGNQRNVIQKGKRSVLARAQGDIAMDKMDLKVAQINAPSVGKDQGFKGLSSLMEITDAHVSSLSKQQQLAVLEQKTALLDEVHQKLHKLQVADDNIADYMRDLWRQKAEQSGNAEFEEELKQVEQDAELAGQTLVSFIQQKQQLISDTEVLKEHLLPKKISIDA